MDDKLTSLQYEDYQALLNQQVQILRACLGDHLTTVVLYSSVARGTATSQSDIDLLVIASLRQRGIRH